MKNFKSYVAAGVIVMLTITGCDDDDKKSYSPKNPDTATKVSIDRFSDDAATLMKRSAVPSLPAANAPINFDAGEPFITKGLGPGGEVVAYYNFDVMTDNPAPIYAFFKPGATDPTGLNVVDVIPGEMGYNDFWRVYKVNVPDDYLANSLTSYEEIQSSGYMVEPTDILVNCPIVPNGSTASKRAGNGSNALSRGWYDGQIVYYFNFEEKTGGIAVTAGGKIPLSPIYVTFNINPDTNNPVSGPASGFKVESGTDQTHNVVATLPSDATYSPLWSVSIYDNNDFDAVEDLVTAQSASHLGFGPGVNCPIVTIE